jgi:hypothetical protein
VAFLVGLIDEVLLFKLHFYIFIAQFRKTQI